MVFVFVFGVAFVFLSLVVFELELGLGPLSFESVFVSVAGRWCGPSLVRFKLVALVVSPSGVDNVEVLPFPLGAKSRGWCAEDQLCHAVRRRVPERARRPPRHLEGAVNLLRSRGTRSVFQVPRHKDPSGPA